MAQQDHIAAEFVTGIKGFDRDFTCRGFKFEPGQTYEHDGEII